MYCFGQEITNTNPLQPHHTGSTVWRAKSNLLWSKRWIRQLTSILGKKASGPCTLPQLPLTHLGF